VRIRLGQPADVQAVCDIEEAAGELFAANGMVAEALAGPPELDEMHELVRAELLWVAVGEDDRPVGYIAMSEVDGHAHLAQVSVDPVHSRRGIGRALIEHAVGWATRNGYSTMTLTTYAEVPWNAPYYERCGFRRMDETEWTPGLRAIRAAEAEVGLDRWPRVCMTRAL
jgi:predicted N-acetyltransferase YhbS